MDFKLLIERLKDKGLDVAEDSAKVVVVETLAWLSGEVKKTGNPFDDLLIPVLPIVEREVLKLVDKIDKKIG